MKMRRRLCSNPDAKGEKMTVTLELPPDLEVELSVRAAERGQAVPDYLLTLAEADVYGEIEMSEAEREEEIALLQERIQDRLSGDKGILLEDYWVGVLAKREARAHQPSPKQAV